MSISIHILTGSKDVKLYAVQLMSVAESAIESVKKLLPIKDIDIVFYDNPEATFKEDEIGGIGGFTPNAIPRWTGYTLGYDLVAAYLQAHPGTLPSQLVSADASLFVEKVK